MSKHSYKNLNYTTILRWSLIGVLLSLIGTCSYIIIFKPDMIELEMIDPDVLPLGEWSVDFEDIIYRYFPEIPMGIVQDEITGDRLIKVEFNKSEGYKGIGIQKTLQLSKHSNFVLEWRHTGEVHQFQCDIKDIDQENPGNGRFLNGEVFSTYVSPVKGEWVTTILPISAFERNEYQTPNSPTDGVIDNYTIQSIDIALPPDDVATIEIRDVYFTQPSPKWEIMLSFIIVCMIGAFLWIRTTRDYLVHLSDHQMFSNAVSTRVIYLLLSMSFISYFLYNTDYAKTLNAAVIFSLFFGLLLVNTKKSGFLTLVLSYRMLLVFAVGWYFGFPQTPLVLLLFLLITAVPIIQNNIQVIPYFIASGIFLFVPVFINPNLPINIEIYILIFVVFFITLVAGRILYENIVKSLQAENTITLYEELFNNTSDAIFSFNDEGTIITVNHGFADIVGRTEDELIERKVQEFIYPDDLRLLPFNHTNVSESLRKYDLRFVKQNGEIVYTNVMERYKHEQGEKDTYQIIARDITQRIQVEQLEKEKTIAERSNEVKSQFLANMSHEIRTPLHGVLTSLEILEHVDTKDDKKQYLDIARTSGRMLLELVNEVLDFSKLESGKLKLTVQCIELSALIYDAVNIVKEQAFKKNLGLSVNLPDGLSESYFGDATRTRQILVNLLGNAVKFTEQGSVTLTASILEDDIQMTLIRIEVKDTGIGIDSKHIDSVFQVFSQVDSSNTRLFGGTGLGLAITKELVHLMNGKIGVDSEVGKGSTFWLEIPFNKNDPSNTEVLPQELIIPSES